MTQHFIFIVGDGGIFGVVSDVSWPNHHHVFLNKIHLILGFIYLCVHKDVHFLTGEA